MYSFYLSMQISKTTIINRYLLIPTFITTIYQLVPIHLNFFIFYLYLQIATKLFMIIYIRMYKIKFHDVDCSRNSE